MGGSEKKRKRRASEADPETPTTDKAERKRLKKAKRDSQNDVAMPEPNELSQVPPLLSPIATPMAGRKLTKKIYKLIGHAAKTKSLRRGIKEVVLAMRKEEKGVVVLAGDVFPVDVIAHVPLLCEEASIPYCFVPRKTELGSAGLTKRPTSVVLVSRKNVTGDVKEELETMENEVREMQIII